MFFTELTCIILVIPLKEFGFYDNWVKYYYHINPLLLFSIILQFVQPAPHDYLLQYIKYHNSHTKACGVCDNNHRKHGSDAHS